MTKKRKPAVMYGAGNIGRGFIGQVFADSGYEVVFIDINPVIVDALNERGAYTQVVVENEGSQSREITGVRAVYGNDRNKVVEEIAACEIMAVSVGTIALPLIAPVIADGLAKRICPLNILVCENLSQAPAILRGFISDNLKNKAILSNIGFVGTSIGRMVPVMPKEQSKKDPTLILVEKFCTLPIDRDAIIQPLPELQHTIPCSPFALEEGKKLFIHNMGHAIVAYLGAEKGYEYIWQAVEDKEIYNCVRQAMTATSQALAKKYNCDLPELISYMEDLLLRFGNKRLGDTIARVGSDPMRKLAPNDRLLGAVSLCKEQGIDHSPILPGIDAALKY